MTHAFLPYRCSKLFVVVGCPTFLTSIVLAGIFLCAFIGCSLRIFVAFLRNLLSALAVIFPFGVFAAICFMETPVFLGSLPSTFHDNGFPSRRCITMMILWPSARL